MTTNASTARRGFVALIGATALAAMSPLPAAAQAYPSKPIKVIVPYAPGGATDILGRMVAAKLQESWGQSVVVENKPGASGVLGNDLVAKAPPDGYTVLLGITAIVQSATLMKLPYDPYKDLIPVSQLAVSTSLLTVPAGTPVKTLAEYVALVKSQPGKHGYGSFGNGTSAHIQGELFKSQTGVDMAHVPYKSGGPLDSPVMHYYQKAVEIGCELEHIPVVQARFAYFQSVASGVKPDDLFLADGEASDCGHELLAQSLFEALLPKLGVK